ncbi:AAA family ATPase [Cyclobacterium jeungdonense]|uniref:ATP-binding protein n=1 Tax=Cyclobacterium jeungdonense TaxID=708087 RepID=A0ABT8C4C6_9BACT|nr:ATP-binding protein [Cyclobacterium jeungdonense]MDN3687638.1 ATP-binding protein [Cyclobacterium jeungdonense]
MYKIVIIGPESTGKSHLSEALSRHYGEPWVPEYAREYLEGLGRPYRYDDLLQIARGQIRAEEELDGQAKELLFCDTDLRVIKIWSEHKYRTTDPWIRQQIKVRAYDLYLLTDIDMPWQEDPLREHPDPDLRTHFMAQYESELDASGVPWVKISGSETNRLESAIQVINRSKGKWGPSP